MSVQKGINNFIHDLSKRFPDHEWSAMAGKKHTRVVRENKETHARSAYCFVRNSDGAIVKAIGWNNPKTVHGSVLNYDINTFDLNGTNFNY